MIKTALKVTLSLMLFGGSFLLPLLTIYPIYQGDLCLKTDWVFSKAKPAVSLMRRMNNVRKGLQWDSLEGRLWIVLGRLTAQQAGEDIQMAEPVEIVGWTFFKWSPPSVFLQPMTRALLEESNRHLLTSQTLWRDPETALTLGLNDFLMKEYEQADRKSTRLNSSHTDISRMPSSA